MEAIELLRHDDPGYKTLVTFNGWRVAFMNDGPKTTIEGLTYLQKHDETDEVFILLKGRCVLILAGYGDAPQEITAVDMEPGVMYNVKKGAWHTHVFYEDTSVAIVENADTAPNNSPMSDLTETQRTTIATLCAK